MSYTGNSGTVTLAKDFYNLLINHVKLAEGYDRHDIKEIHITKAKDLEITYEHAIVSAEREVDRYEEHATMPKVLDNKEGETEKTFHYKPEIKESKGIEKLASKYSEWRVGGELSAMYMKTGGTISIDYKKGQVKTRRRTSDFQVVDSHEQSITVPAGKECTVSLIKMSWSSMSVMWKMSGFVVNRIQALRSK